MLRGRIGDQTFNPSNGFESGFADLGVAAADACGDLTSFLMVSILFVGGRNSIRWNHVEMRARNRRRRHAGSVCQCKLACNEWRSAL